MRQIKPTFILFLLFLARVALAESYFGAEFTMTNQEIMDAGAKAGAIVNIPEAVKAQKALLEEFTKDCLKTAKCVVKSLNNTYGARVFQISFPEQDGFWVQISTDPSVVEIQTKPSTLAEYTKHEAILDELFQAGKRVGISPDSWGTGGGHIHMDFASTFGEDKRLFRNFLVDFMNHQELGGSGIFGSDTSNAPHLNLLTQEQQAEFRKVIHEFDTGRIKDSRALAEAINKRVYYQTPSGWRPPVKYQALNLTRMSMPDGEATIEFRGIGPQRNPQEFLQQLKLFEQRVEFLRKQDGLLELLDFKTMSRAEKIGAFRSFVEESGLAWDEYQKLMRRDNHLAGEAKAFSRVHLVAQDAAADAARLNAGGVANLNCENRFQFLWNRIVRSP